METKRATIYSGLRNIFLRSKERAQCLKDNNYTCQKCMKKQSMKKGQEFKVQVHHKDGIANWDKIIEEIRKELLNGEMIVLCKECHKQEHGTTRDYAGS